MVPARRVLMGLLFSTTAMAFAVQPAVAQTPSAPDSPSQQAEGQTPTTTSDDGDIVVTGRFIPNEKRETSEIVSLLGAEDLARGGDSDIAASLTRVTGLSLVGGRFVYVRGLGGRYSAALLDGSVLPSPEPLRRVTPLDVFPTDLLSGVLVQKTYSVEFPGEFAGGLVSMRSRAVPEENFFEFGISGGVNDKSTFHTGIGYYGGELDALGFRNNTYSLPLYVRTNPSLNGFDAGQLQLAGRALVNNGPGFSLARFKNYPDLGVNLSLGKRFEVGGMSAGILLAGVYDRQVRNEIGVRNRYSRVGTGLGIFESFSADACVGFNPVLNPNSCGRTQTKETVNLSLISSLGVEIDGDNTVTLKSILLRKTDKIGEEQRGTQPISAPNQVVSDYRLAYIEQELWINQVTGEHKFELGVFPDSVFSWRAAYDRASRVTPYLTDYRYILTPTDTSFQLSNQQAQFGISFTGLRDNNYEGGMDFVLKGEPFGFESVFKFGGLYTRKNRDYATRRYTFNFPGGNTDALRRFVPEIIFSSDNIGPGGFVLTQPDQGANSYSAQQEIYAGYISTELQVADPLRLTGGVRFERSKQKLFGGLNSALIPGGACVATGPVVGFRTPIRCELTSERLLPAATATFEFADNMQVRAGYSRTLSRPDLRELSPAVILNIEEDVEEEGNPNLIVSTIDNFDSRFEWYFGKNQLFSLGGFYKKIKNPIERSLSVFGDEGRRTYIQADSAEVYGGEAEITLTLPLADWFGSSAFLDERRFFVIGNITYSKSAIQISPAQIGVLTSASRPMEGQSEWLGNLQFGYEMEGERFALLFNYASERISDVGTQTRPDIYERPPVDLDFTFAKTFPIVGRDIEFSAKVSNMLNRGFLRTQGGLVYEAHALGRSYSAGLKVRF